MILVTVITSKDNLQQIVNEINQASWDDANDMSVYDAESLFAYLEHPDTLFISCYEFSNDERTLLGIASSRIEIKPYEKKRWLYVDEVDVCSDQRQKGAGKAMMQKLIEIARESGCEELWLGTEIENVPANALYRSLKPNDIASVVGYTYVTDGP